MWMILSVKLVGDACLKVMTYVFHSKLINLDHQIFLHTCTYMSKCILENNYPIYDTPIKLIMN